MCVAGWCVAAPGVRAWCVCGEGETARVLLWVVADTDTIPPKQIDQFGSEAQRQRWLPRMATLDLFSSYCLTCVCRVVSCLRWAGG